MFVLQLFFTFARAPMASNMHGLKPTISPPEYMSSIPGFDISLINPPATVNGGLSKDTISPWRPRVTSSKGGGLLNTPAMGTPMVNPSNARPTGPKSSDASCDSDLSLLEPQANVKNTQRSYLDFNTLDGALVPLGAPAVFGGVCFSALS